MKIILKILVICLLFLSCNNETTWKYVETINSIEYSSYIKLIDNVNNPFKTWVSYTGIDCGYDYFGEPSPQFQIIENLKENKDFQEIKKDIYLNVKEKVCYVEAIDKNTNQRLEARFKITNLNSSEKTELNGSKIKYVEYLMTEGNKYNFEVNHNGYILNNFDYSVNHAAFMNDTLKLRIPLTPIKIGEKVVQHQERKYGTTKFGLIRFINGPLDLLSIMFVSRFGKKPMHLFGLAGTLMFLIGFALTAYLGLEKLFYLNAKIKAPLITDRPWFYLALVVMIIGVQLFLAGFLGELLSRSSSDRNHYLEHPRLQ